MVIPGPLALTEDQRGLRDTLRACLADQLPSAALRAMIDTEPGYRPSLHAQLAATFGLAGLTIPERFGGRALSQAEAGMAYAELGRALYPGPFLPTALTAGVLLGAADPAAPPAARAAAERWLPRLADGSVTGTIAAADRSGRWITGPGTVRAHLTPHGWRLYGSCWYVIAAHVAAIWVVSARAGSVPTMFLVEADAPGLRSVAQRGLDLSRRTYVTSFDATPAVLLAQDDRAVAALAAAERDFLLATAAEATGGIGWCLDTAVLYAKDRVQVGQPACSSPSRTSAWRCSRPSSPPKPPPATPRSWPRAARPRPRPRRGSPPFRPARPTAR